MPAARSADCPWVFSRHGEQIKDFKASWGEACKRAGVPGLLFHDLRRTADRIDGGRCGSDRSQEHKYINAQAVVLKVSESVSLTLEDFHFGVEAFLQRIRRSEGRGFSGAPDGGRQILPPSSPEHDLGRIRPPAASDRLDSESHLPRSVTQTPIITDE